MELKKPIKIKDKEIKKLDLAKEKFTADVIIRAEKEFLVTGGVFPSGAMEDSRAYLLVVASKMLDVRTDELQEQLSGEDFISVTDVIKGFYNGTGLNALIQNFLGNQQS
ncbi:hypothetical protein VSU16_03500 [Cetobacterium somerae]|uniref:hypothetical protein n=2 Tax=Cetobacterium TaxID=180162 RepID=UPI002E7B6D2F|nr:hypothetical protein [Cetobacterium somerae]WVJ01807.1 hypothetical protein VSU16_03500 [Cetobacterium somerae]